MKQAWSGLNSIILLDDVENSILRGLKFLDAWTVTGSTDAPVLGAMSGGMTGGISPADNLPGSTSAWYFLNDNDVAQLLFFRRQRRRRGSNAAVVSIPRPAGHGTGDFFCSCRALSLLCARHSPSDERPSSRFRGIKLTDGEDCRLVIPRSA